MYKNYFKEKQLCFRKWLNKKYAQFNSLGRLVKIGTLTVSYALIVIPVKAKGENDSITVFYPNFDIEEVSVAGSRSTLLEDELAKIVNIVPAKVLANSPAGSINDQLDLLPGVDMRTRGPLGVQSDISIRGGNFEQATILLNGIKITDPQTGHNSLNLPIDLKSVNRIELIKGPSSRVFGASAFSGAVNIVAQPDYNDYVIGNVSFGQHGYNHVTGQLNKKIGISRHMLSVNNTSTSGYTDNTDFSVLNLYYHSITEMKAGKLSVQGGYQNKFAGAQNFYTTAFPTQFEQMRTKFASATFDGSLGNIKIKPKVYVRRGHDRFELYREGSNYYNRIDSLGIWVNQSKGDTALSFYNGHNYHMNTVTGFENDFSYTSKYGTTNLGVEYRIENILSNTMGNIRDSIKAPGEENGHFYKELTRNTTGLYLEHALSLKKFSINGGLLLQYSSDSSWQVFPGIDIKYKVNDGLHVFANVNKATRIPSFTELYYRTSTHVSDPNLKPENTLSSEVGIMFQKKALSGYLTIFISDGENLIDWVQDTNNLILNGSGIPMWQSKNISSSKTTGFETRIKYDFTKVNENIIIKSASIDYTYITKEITSGEYISAYALDYMKHKVNVGVNLSYKGMYLSVFTSIFDRNDYYNYISKQDVVFDPYFLLDARLGFRGQKMEIYLDANNIFNTKYFDYIGVEMPGVWIRGGISRKLSL